MVKREVVGGGRKEEKGLFFYVPLSTVLEFSDRNAFIISTTLKGLRWRWVNYASPSISPREVKCFSEEIIHCPAIHSFRDQCILMYAALIWNQGHYVLNIVDAIHCSNSNWFVPLPRVVVRVFSFC